MAARSAAAKLRPALRLALPGGVQGEGNVNQTALWLGIGYAAACAVGLAVFALVVRSTRRGAAEPDIGRLERSERAWLWFVVVGLFALLAVTIFDVPWNAAAQSNRLEVKVTASQFAWKFEPTGPYPTGRQVEFLLSSTDVNHDFGLYGPNGAFVLQAQAIPNTVTKVSHTFHTTGHYTVRCLEYCGVLHHQMIDGFTVRTQA